MNKIIKSKIILTLLAVGIGWLGLSLVNIKIQEEEIYKEVVELENKINNLEKDNEQISQSIQNLQNPVFLEKEARLEFNYKLPGEEVAFVYLDTSSISSASAESDKVLFRLPGFVSLILNFFGFGK